MSAAAIFQLLVLLVLLGVTVPPLGRYLAGVFGDPELGGEPEPTLGERLFGPIERVIYRACRVNPGAQQRWTVYAMSLLAFSLVSVLGLGLVYVLAGGMLWSPDRATVVAIMAMSALLGWRHQENISRLVQGKESRLGKSKEAAAVSATGNRKHRKRH